MNIDIANILGQKWASDQKKEAQYHIHPEGQEGASNLGGCIVVRAMKEAGIKLPPLTGVKADFGAAFVGDVWHEKIQMDLVAELSRLYPQYVVGPVIENGEPQEIIVETEILPGQMVVSPIDLCMVTRPGFIKKLITYENVTKERYVKHPEAQFVLVGDIKSAAPTSYSIHEEQGIGDEYDAQMLDYLQSCNLPSMFVLFVNKLNGHRFTLVVEFTAERWKTLQEKRLREMQLATDLRNHKKCNFIKTDFKYCTSDAEFICAYCRRSETHDIFVGGMTRVILDKPCPEAVEIVENEFMGKFVVGSKWMRGASMVLIDKVENGKVYVHNKSGTLYDDTVFHAAKTYVEGWEKKQKDDEKKPRVIHPSVLKPIVIYDGNSKVSLAYEDNVFSQPPPIVKDEGYGNPENICMKCGAGEANPGTGQCQKCDDTEEASFKQITEQELAKNVEIPLVLLPPELSDEEAFQNIQETLGTCTFCKNPRMAGQKVCTEHYHKIGEAIKDI